MEKLKIEKKGKIEGRIEGKTETLVDNMKKVMNKLNYTIEEAMDFLEVPINQRKEIQALLNV